MNARLFYALIKRHYDSVVFSAISYIKKIDVNNSDNQTIEDINNKGYELSEIYSSARLAHHKLLEENSELLKTIGRKENAYSRLKKLLKQSGVKEVSEALDEIKNNIEHDKIIYQFNVANAEEYKTWLEDIDNKYKIFVRESMKKKKQIIKKNNS